MINQQKLREPRSDQTSQRDESQKASLRNKSHSGDKSSIIWPNQDRGDREYSDKNHIPRSVNVSQDESALHIDYHEKKTNV
jgi:hypothetical protein